MITIADPVAGSHYMLDAGAQSRAPDERCARHRKAGSPEATQEFQQKMEARLQKEEASGAVKKESLGTQSINGVNAEGTRITRTIAAGQIGNDKADPDRVRALVFPRPASWWSRARVRDPRFGTTTYTLDQRAAHRTGRHHCSPFRPTTPCSKAVARAIIVDREPPGPHHRSNRQAQQFRAATLAAIEVAAQRASLLKTERPSRGIPQCRGRGAAVFGGGVGGASPVEAASTSRLTQRIRAVTCKLPRAVCLLDSHYGRAIAGETTPRRRLRSHLRLAGRPQRALSRPHSRRKRPLT